MSTTAAGVVAHRRVIVRRRRALATALLGAALGCVLLATVVLSDLLGGSVGPATGAADVVPADALAYVHVSTDRSRPGVGQALTLLHRLPLAPPVLTPLRSVLAGAPGWLGAEAGLAVLPEGDVTVLDVRNRSAAGRALRAGAGAGATVAFVRHYAVVGSADAVAATVAAAGHGQTLAQNAAFRRASAGEPGDRVADAYLPAAGVSRLLLGHPGPAAMFGTLLWQPTLLGTSLTLSPAAGGVRVRIHSALDPGLTGMTAAGHRTFTPTLQSVVPAGATLMLDGRALDRNAPRLLAAAAQAGVGGSIRPLLQRLGAALGAEGVNVPSILHVFDGESAVALVPSSAGSQGNPSLLVVARVADEAGARATLAGVEAPLAQLFSGTAAGAGQTPILNDVAVGADSVHELSLAPGLTLDYAVAHGIAIVSTSRGPVVTVLRRAAGLSGDPAYRAVLPTGPDGVSSLVFLDFNQLLNLVGQTGLTRGVRFEALRPDLQRMRAIGIRSTSGEADSTAELFLHIS